jgi:hypothetical protein
MSLSLAKRPTPTPAPSPLAAPPLLDGGRALEPATRSSFESGFGQDFSRVRVHDDARAHEAARGMNARAYAAGDHIVFGEGQYRPETPSGQALIAHELAHSVQQAGVAMKADGPLPAASDARLEAEADRAPATSPSGSTPSPCPNPRGRGNGCRTPIARPPAASAWA